MSGSILNDGSYPTIGDFIQALLNGKSLCPLVVHELLLTFQGDDDRNRIIAEVQKAIAALSIENRDRLYLYHDAAELLEQVAWEGG